MIKKIQAEKKKIEGKTEYWTESFGFSWENSENISSWKLLQVICTEHCLLWYRKDIFYYKEAKNR